MKREIFLLKEKYKNSQISDENLKFLLIKDIRENFTYISDIKDQYLLMEEVFSNLRGYGYIDKYLLDKSVTEIMVNSTCGIFIEKDGEIIKVEDKYKKESQVEDIIQKMVGKSGREINTSSPIVDSNLEDGSRINAIFRPLSTIGPVLTIRKFNKDRYSLRDLLNFRTINEEIRIFLMDLVKNKYNILISGGTGSGKTTFLNALADLCTNERIIVIEDSREIQLKNIDNAIYLETRNKNTSGIGEINIRDLIKASLRMRPDRIVVGEVRGKEAIDMLQAMNTGHEGSISTIHANSTRDSISRLETMILQGGEIPLKALTKQIISSLDIIIQLEKIGKERKLVEISEIKKDMEDRVYLSTIYSYEKGKFIKKNNLENIKEKDI